MVISYGNLYDEKASTHRTNLKVTFVRSSSKDYKKWKQGGNTDFSRPWSPTLSFQADKHFFEILLEVNSVSAGLFMQALNPFIFYPKVGKNFGCS